MSRSIARWIGVALAVFALVLPIQAQNVLTIRVDSFESLVDDVDAIAVALGQPKGSADGWLQMAQGALGMPQFDWVDKKSPFVLALPLEGMMLGQNGFVGALPVSDVDAAVSAMKSAVEGVEVDENGLIHVPTGEQSEMVLLPKNGYLVFGQNPNLVGGFDPTELLSGAHLPPGTIAAEFNVDSMRAMIGMAMQGARQNIAATIAQKAEEQGEALDAESAAAVANMGIEWVEALVANTRSVQLALELTDSHLIVHNHYLPVSGSALEGFLRAQKGGMPDVARLLDGEDSSMTLVGNVTWTDEAIAAFEGLMNGYATLVQDVMAKNEELGEMGALAELMPQIMDQYGSMWKCMRGDIAQVVHLSDGLQFTQVSGIRDSEECGDLDQRVLDMTSELPEELSEIFTISPNGLTHRGVTALEYGMDFGKFGDLSDEEGVEEAMTMLNGMFGEDGFKTYMALSDGYWISSGGAGADVSMRRLIDRIKDKKRGGGIDETAFEPFTVGAGLYFMMDFGRFFGGLSGFLPESADTAEIAELQEVFGALGAMTGGVDFQRDALGLKFAMPTAGLSKIGEMAQREAADDE